MVIEHMINMIYQIFMTVYAISRFYRGLGLNATLGSIKIVNVRETLSSLESLGPRPPLHSFILVYSSIRQTSIGLVYLPVYNFDSNLGMKKNTYRLKINFTRIGQKRAE